MLKFAGNSVAMGNGSESAKAAATLVTDSLYDDGIYKALLKLGVI